MGLRSDCLERGREVCSGDVSESGWGIDDLRLLVPKEDGRNDDGGSSSKVWVSLCG